MKRIYLLIATLALTLLAGCPGTFQQAPSKNAVLKGSYDTVDAYVQVVTGSYIRGRLTADQAARQNAKAKKAFETITVAELAFADCGKPAPAASAPKASSPSCAQYPALMESLSPLLLEFEAELRKQEGAKK